MSDANRAEHREAIPVVAAVVRRDRSVLLCQRHAGPHLSLLWEFPGGKVDPGESAPVALVRELSEELDVQASVGALLHEVIHDYLEKRVWIRFFAVTIVGEPRPLVHRDVRWVPFDELDRYAAPPPNARVIALIRSGELAIH